MDEESTRALASRRERAGDPPRRPGEPPAWPGDEDQRPGDADQWTGGGPEQPGAAEKADRALWPWLVLVVALVFAGSGVWFAYRKVAVQDSGIVACQAMAAGDRSFAGQGGDTKLSETEYRRLRKVFADSRYDDIRDHGTKLIDVVWQGQQLGDGAVLYLQPLATHLSGLQSACADQGFFINLKPAAATRPSDGVACDDLFPPAGPITAPAATSECTTSTGATMLVTAMSCTDGRRLFQLIAPGGTNATSYGFGGDKPHPMSDGTYATALTGCLK